MRSFHSFLDELEKIAKVQAAVSGAKGVVGRLLSKAPKPAVTKSVAAAPKPTVVARSTPATEEAARALSQRQAKWRASYSPGHVRAQQQLAQREAARAAARTQYRTPAALSGGTPATVAPTAVQPQSYAAHLSQNRRAYHAANRAQNPQMYTQSAAPRPVYQGSSSYMHQPSLRR